MVAVLFALVFSHVTGHLEWEGLWGDWGPVQYCPGGSYAIKVCILKTFLTAKGIWAELTCVQNTHTHTHTATAVELWHCNIFHVSSHESEYKSTALLRCAQMLLHGVSSLSFEALSFASLDNKLLHNFDQSHKGIVLCMHSVTHTEIY